MKVSRRSVIGTAGAAAMGLGHTTSRLAIAKDATPAAIPNGSPVVMSTQEPGYGIARVRTLPNADLNQAIYPLVMSRFLPMMEAVPGFAGYVFAFDIDDPASTLTFTATNDAESAAAADQTAEAFVSDLDPRFTTETPFAEEGPLRIFATTDRPASELPPFLHGCRFTLRSRVTTPGTDVDAVVQGAKDGLVPIMQEIEGFVLYVWMELPGGRVAMNIWETAEQQDAGDAAVAKYVAENTVATTVGDAVVYNGLIGYAELPLTP